MQASSPTNISQVVRTETDYWAIVQYIDENPLKWVLDPLYQEEHHEPV